jgi:hypothetical protein
VTLDPKLTRPLSSAAFPRFLDAALQATASFIATIFNFSIPAGPQTLANYDKILKYRSVVINDHFEDIYLEAIEYIV